MSKPVYLNENDLVRRGDVIAAFDNLKCIAAGKEYPADDLKCQFTGTILTVPPASEKTAITRSTEIVMDFATVKKKMALAEKILELDRKIARLDKSIQEVGDDERTCSMVITCNCVMPFTDIEGAEVKSMLRVYRDNLRIKLDALWDEFAIIGLGKEEKV